MSDPSLSTARQAALPSVRGAVLRNLAIALVIVLAAFAPGLARYGLRPFLGALRIPHLPNPEPILAAPIAVQLHLATIAAAILIGGVLMSGVKGGRLHRAFGWTWASLLALTAASALFIHAPTGRRTSPGSGFCTCSAA